MTIRENEAGQRLDRFLRKYLRNAPLSMIYRLIRKDLKVNGKRGREDTMLCAGDELTFYLSEAQLQQFVKPTKSRKVKKQFQIAYEDADCLIVNKPKGLLTHGDASEKKHTLANQVCGYLQEQGVYDPSRERTFVPSPVNRLDRNTTGLVVFGKNANALRVLTAAIRQRSQVNKYYLAIVCGSVRETMHLADALEKDTGTGSMLVVSGDSGLSAETIVRPRETGSRFSLVEAQLITGRTHQIRVHLSHAGHPLAADPRYGDPRVNRKLRDMGVTSQLLHAYRLEFGDISLPELAGKTITARPPGAFQAAGRKLIHDGISFV